MPDLSAEDERRVTSLVELGMGFLLVVAMQVSKENSGSSLCFGVALAAVALNALCVVVAAWSRGRNNNVKNQNAFRTALTKLCTGGGTIYKVGFNPKLSLYLPAAAALLQASAVWVETNGPGAWAERLSSFSVALAFALPTVLESVEATPHSNQKSPDLTARRGACRWLMWLPCPRACQDLFGVDA